MQILFTSPWVPAEWIKAHGLEPRGVWYAPELGFHALPLAAGACAFATAVVRLAQDAPDAAVIFTTHCDQLRRGFDSLAGSARGRVFLFNLPVTWQRSVAADLYRGELERLGRFLVACGGNPPTASDVQQIITEYSSLREQLLAAAPSCPPQEYVEAVARFHWDGTVHLPPAQEADTPSNPKAVALALVGGPLPRSQWDLIELIERAGGRVVLNGTEAGERSLWPATALPCPPASRPDLQTTFHALAQQYLANCVDVFQRPNTRLYDWLRLRLAARRVRGIVLWQFVGCDLWRAEAQSFREAFGLPVLVLEADETASGLPRTRGRLEAFVETLR